LPPPPGPVKLGLGGGGSACFVHRFYGWFSTDAMLSLAD
jgi:hypothetical protein